MDQQRTKTDYASCVCWSRANGPEEISWGHLLGAGAFNSPTGLDLDFLIRLKHGEHTWLNSQW